MFGIALLIVIVVGPIAAAAIGTFGATTGILASLIVYAILGTVLWWRLPRSPWRKGDWEPVDSP